MLQTIATACMFLAGKVEETPRPLKDVILVSYDIMNKKDPVAVQKIKQKVLFAIFFASLPVFWTLLKILVSYFNYYMYFAFP